LASKDLERLFALLPTFEHQKGIRLFDELAKNPATAGPRPRALRATNLERERNPGFSTGKKKRKKKPNKWRLNRPHGQERSLVKREMALAEVRRHEAAKRLFPFRPQVLRRIFTVPRHTVLMRSKACSGRC